MLSNVPESHIFDAHELESKGVRDLYKIELRNVGGTLLFLTPHNTIEYQGKVWEAIPSKLTENSQNSTGEVSRPKFSTVNPQGVFSLWVQQGVLDGAILTRYRVLLPDLEADNAAYMKNIWIISKVLSMNAQMLTFELRSILDGVNFTMPNRSFYPPDFPHVSLR